MAKEKEIKKKAKKKVSTKAPRKKKKKKVNNPKAKWYVLNIRTGYENAIQKELQQRIEASGLENKIVDILVPVQKKIVIKKGKQKVEEDKIFPGYILVKMELDELTWEIINNIDGIRGFVRTDKKPRPLPESEVQAIMQYMKVEQPSYQSSFSVGEAVKITEGAFADFIGSVQEIDQSKGKVKVLISFLGREAPVELEFSQVTKL